MKWKVLVGFNGVPLVDSTPPPPDAAEFVTQSPMPFAGKFASRSPSMPKPPVGEVTGATPFGGAAHAAASVKKAVAVEREGNPVAVTWSVAPNSSSPMGTTHTVQKLQLASA